MRRKKEPSLLIPVLICIAIAFGLVGVISVATKHRPQDVARSLRNETLNRVDQVAKDSHRDPLIEDIAQESVIEPAPKSLVRSAINAVSGVITTPRPTITKAAITPGFDQQSNDPFTQLLLGVVVENTTSKAISELTFYMRLGSDRTIPYGDKLKKIQIRGGIEAGETKQLQLNLTLRDFGIAGNLPPAELPEHSEFSVGVVLNGDLKQGQELHELDIPMTLATYHYREVEDPNWKAFQQLEMRP